MNIFKRWLSKERHTVTKPPEADWIQRQGELIFTVRLSHLSDTLDPDLLWDTGGDVVRVGEGSATAAGRKSLKEALKTYRKETFFRKPGFDFPIPRYVVFTDVVLWVDERLWNEQDISGNEKLFMLVDKLRHRHGETFKGNLLLDRQPRYAVMPYAGLARHEIICQFGLGVFVPDENDRQVAELEIVKGEQVAPFPVWWTLKAEGALVQKLHRPAGFYEQQYFLLIGQQLPFAAIQSPLWFSHKSGYLVLNTRNQPETIHGDGLFVDADLAGVRRENGVTSCRFHAKNHPDDAVVLNIRLLDRSAPRDIAEPVPMNPAPAPVAVQTVDFSASGMQSTFDEPTPPDEVTPPPQSSESTPVFSEHTFVDPLAELNHPLSGFTVTHVDDDEPLEIAYGLYINGLILPKARQLPGGHRYWQLSLDREGMPVTGEKGAFWVLRGDVDGGLAWKKVSESAWHALSLTGEADISPEFSDIAMLLQKAPIESALGIYQLPFPIAVAGLEARLYSLGRNGDIRLEVLEQATHLGGGHDSTLTLNQLRFSSVHVLLELIGDHLKLTQQSHNSPSYVLQGPTGVLRCLEPGSAQSVDLQSGDRFIVGGYQLWFKQANCLM